MSITERQQKWFAGVRASFKAETGRTLEEWIEVASTCPETKHRAKLAWFKAEHGLGQNRASIVLQSADPGGPDWAQSDALLDALWTDPAARAIYDAVAAKVRALPETTIGPRKAFVGFSRKVQFAAMRPVRGGGALLGLDVAPDADPRLQPMRRESWSERLKSTAALAGPEDVDAGLEALLRRAWERAV